MVYHTSPRWIFNPEKHYWSKVPCKHNHQCPRKFKNHACIECIKLKRRRLYKPKRTPQQRQLISDRTRANKWAKKVMELRSTPYWVDVEALKEIYLKRLAAERATGELYHIDHIIPKNNPLVSGLTVPWNLQVLPAKQNMKKGNSF